MRVRWALNLALYGGREFWPVFEPGTRRGWCLGLPLAVLADSLTNKVQFKWF